MAEEQKHRIEGEHLIGYSIMTNNILTYRIDWNVLPWNQPMPGLRFKAFQQSGRRIRLAEFGREFKEPDWCRNGHIGYVFEGEGNLQFSNEMVYLKSGDGLFIPPGEEHRHMLHVLSPRMSILLVEDDS